ncbi:helix-turn-helix domain-containing protein [Kibdelosporangium philippinense]|uniref:Helix-turn-helix domain-containing protein n=1 Tax=Kibdelosporangium philippinense TaxID=211113 RepID=A0ABS8Z097_9PSEU|nr:IclR family transcriptional regulator C-terminal domain-containing protein [Kibdelosporangium philippinense]MCE7001401.1 helix-turn-helix domain-containing protein [Kibdelosporangium philippinense]
MSDFVQSLERGLAVIRAFDADHPEMTLSDVARVTGLTRAAARRFLLTLVDLGYMRTDGRMFMLRPKVLELGYSYLSSLGLPDVAQPHLEKLALEVHESCSVSVLDGSDIVYVARVPTKRIMKVMIEIGTRFPAHATSMGRVMLAAQDNMDFLDTPLPALTDRTITDPVELKAELVRVRAQGWSMVDEELEHGLRSIAAPIRNKGKVIGALNISTHVSRPIDSVHTELVPPLLTTAEAISRDLPS